MKLNQLKDKKILILGFGREGRDTFKFLETKRLAREIGIADQKKITDIPRRKNIKFFFGKNYLNSIKNYDVIIKSPGIPYRVVKPFIKKDHKLTSQTEIFFDNFEGKIIGITGTKGKSTTTTLIYKILKEANLKVHLVGNIGKPVLTTLIKARPDDIFVYELSCHQLNKLRKSPYIAVFLDIFPEHLDYYKNFNAYFRAKQNICLHQKKSDYFIFNSDFQLLRNLSKKVKSNLLSFGFKSFRNRIAYLKDNWIFYNGKKVINTKDVPLLGQHNISNVMAAIIVAKVMHCPNQSIKKAIKSFKSLEHRLEFVGKFKGILFYNDSLSTIPQATIAALDALKDKGVSSLILGGYDRGIDFGKFAKNIANFGLKTIIFFPPSGLRIHKSILRFWPSRNKNKPNFFFAKNMREAVKLCYNYTPKGKVCLLSPASPSFGLFKNYKDRGEQFIKYVKQVSRLKVQPPRKI